MALFIQVSLYCTLLSLITLGTLRFNPRLFLQDYPTEIRRIVPSKNVQEKGLSLCVGFAFTFIYLWIPYRYLINNGRDWSIICQLMTVALFYMAFNIVDLLVLDYLIFVRWTPDFLILEGTEGHPSYKDMKVHYDGFKKGTAAAIMLSIIMAALHTVT